MAIGGYFRDERWKFLLLSLLLDLLSGVSIAMPFVGELLDLIWAPVSAFLLNKMYGNRTLSRVQFWKEILPFTDILPIATLSWFVEYTDFGRALARTFGFGKRRAPTAPTRPD